MSWIKKKIGPEPTAKYLAGQMLAQNVNNINPFLMYQAGRVDALKEYGITSSFESEILTELKKQSNYGL